uniref:Eukaryotic translation initiation factor 3 subunit L n=1 Tax=Pseudo-nitzschia australis TaxID=44445 RepID=A0A7S4AY74_9STRA|mmetsp:Transcript_993/g.2286  ORF Transcript_993/g.2286 Transcript_993/m.2286 type:complete len:536 (+) Transcript_993:112-1719(+)|eukprot:CAMPEP_0168184546 /NCGR_PEP_ID=MMETSP0139_2-20121125/13304_1 /TAXON_ID=44445 /ORGANISM="Pseudo-nitzschia australis, Strain 10249 10 AB" /LENGTH=535 /DNA_ID=CAMNT_0008106189 /DNA_START=52 /DNA_END=1659 /DNA_ORIENTATION=-
MATDADIVPHALTDFVFDLYDSVTLSQLTEEQTRLYNDVFQDLSKKYFASTPWPSPTAIAVECNGDPLFLAFYRELTHRHWHAVSRPSLRERMEGWDVYRELFDELLEGAEADSTSDDPKLFILPGWAFEILHEFVYQFQGFCQFRTTLFASANKYKLLQSADSADGEGAPTPSGKRGPPHHVVENLALMQEDAAKDCWSVDTVMYYLHRLVDIGTSPKCTVPAYQYFGIFATVALSRLECLLTDYSASLGALAPVLENSTTRVVKHDQETKTFTQVIQSVFPARLSLTYHAGISFLMLRRYKDAATTVGDLCTYMQRGFKTGQIRSMPNVDQLYKNYDRMIALLAICTHICPQLNLVEESIAKTIREKHGAQMSKEAFTELFVFCAPKFVSPAIPDFVTSGSIDNVYKQQIYLFEQELKDQPAFQTLRSYLKLYTSIPTSKLINFGNKEPTLASLKLKMQQLEISNSEIPSLKEATLKSALDIQFYAEKVEGSVDEIVHVDEAEKQRRYENYFFGQATQSYDIRKTAKSIDTSL